jgi:hypothetical protein
MVRAFFGRSSEREQHGRSLWSVVQPVSRSVVQPVVQEETS